MDGQLAMQNEFIETIEMLIQYKADACEHWSYG
jgi:hypothetical protein